MAAARAGRARWPRPHGDYGHSPDKYLELTTIEPGIRFAQALLEKLFGEKMKKGA